jgi:hypothetical protein
MRMMLVVGRNSGSEVKTMKYGQPIGWRGESHRHYLASKGVKTKMQKIVLPPKPMGDGSHVHDKKNPYGIHRHEALWTAVEKLQEDVKGLQDEEKKEHSKDYMAGKLSFDDFEEKYNIALEHGDATFEWRGNVYRTSDGHMVKE